MKDIIKPVEKIQISDLKEFPVWEFPKAGETIVRPVQDLPVTSLRFRLVGTQVRLANGDHVWADLFNVNPNDRQWTQQFLTLTVHNNDTRFVLARYFDIDYADNGPEAIAKFLGLPVGEVFPISYDISAHVVGDPAGLTGAITKDPIEKLTNAEIRALIFSSLEKNSKE